jgi:phage-related protein
MPKPRSKWSPFLEDIGPCRIHIFYFMHPNGKCPVEDDFLSDPKKVSKAEKARLAALIRRYALEGELKGETRIRRLKGRVRDFWEIKAHQHRIFFFKESQNRIVITHGFVKKSDKLKPEEEDRMLSYREIYQNQSLYK